MENKTYSEQILDIQRMIESDSIINTAIALTEVQVKYLRVCNRLYRLYEARIVDQLKNAIMGKQMSTTTVDEVFDNLSKDISE